MQNATLIRQKVWTLLATRNKRLVISLLLMIGASSFMQLSESRPKTMSIDRLPNGTQGRVITSQFACAKNPKFGFIKIDFTAEWTEATYLKRHSTLLHLGRTERNGIRVDLGKSSAADSLSYYLIVGDLSMSSGYRVEEFPLSQIDYGRAQLFLTLTSKSYNFRLRTNSGNEFISQGKPARVDCQRIYVGGGPPDLVPGFTDIALYPSETFNSELTIEQGEIRSVSRIGLPISVYLASHWILRLSTLVLLLCFAVSVPLRGKTLIVHLQGLRNIDPKSTFMTVAILLWTMVIPAWWVQGGYEDIAITEKLAFFVWDGWCDPVAQGVGRHCFSDFQTPFLGINSPTPLSYANERVFYPPPALLPFVVVDWISEVLNFSGRATLWLYLSCSALALSVPAIFILLTKNSQRLPLAYLLGPSSLPALLVLDRGNNLAFTIPFIFLYGALARNKRYVIASIALAFAVVVKPQFVLLYLVLLGLRQFRAVLVGALASSSLLVVGFVAFPGSLPDNLQGWIRNSFTFQELGPPIAEYPANLSAARAAFQFSQITGINFIQHQQLGLAVLLIVFITILFRGRHLNLTALFFSAAVCSFLVPGTSYHYYLAVILPVTAIFVTSEASAKGSRHWISDQIFAVFAALTLVPLPIAIGQSSMSVTPHFSGLFCLTILIGLMLGAWVPESRTIIGSKDGIVGRVTQTSSAELSPAKVTSKIVRET